VELVGYLYPFQGKLTVSSLTKAVRRLVGAVRPPPNGQFEKLAFGLLGAVRPPLGAVRPPWAESALKPFSLLTSISTRVEMAKAGLEVC
jgi:hypothetical protein